MDSHEICIDVSARTLGQTPPDFRIFCQEVTGPVPAMTESPVAHRRWFQKQAQLLMEQVASSAQSHTWHSMSFLFAYQRFEKCGERPTLLRHSLHETFSSLSYLTEARFWAQSLTDAIFPEEENSRITGFANDKVEGEILLLVGADRLQAFQQCPKR